jgi:hypothetical protein
MTPEMRPPAPDSPDPRLSPEPPEDPKPQFDFTTGITNKWDCVKDCVRPAGHYGACIKGK